MSNKTLKEEFDRKFKSRPVFGRSKHNKDVFAIGWGIEPLTEDIWSWFQPKLKQEWQRGYQEGVESMLSKKKSLNQNNER